MVHAGPALRSTTTTWEDEMRRCSSMLTVLTWWRSGTWSSCSTTGPHTPRPLNQSGLVSSQSNCVCVCVCVCQGGGPQFADPAPVQCGHWDGNGETGERPAGQEVQLRYGPVHTSAARHPAGTQLHCVTHSCHSYSSECRLCYCRRFD